MRHHPPSEPEDSSRQFSDARRASGADKTALTIHDALAAPRAANASNEARDSRFSETALSYLREQVFIYRLLSETEQARLRQRVRRFLDAKFWEGCAGLRITEEMQLSIAAQACLLVLGFEDYCFEELKTILVYPSGYLGIDEQRPNKRPNHRLGEAHAGGPVVLSWWHARWGGRYGYRRSVVLHEFAHKLAEMGDPHAGMPPMRDARQAERWSAVVDAERRQLRADADYCRPSLLDPYGAVNPAEFFAVASECFFLRPVALGQRHPALYQQLAEWYRQDPAAWRVEEAAEAHAALAEEEELRHTVAECDALLKRFPDHLDSYRQRAACWLELDEFANALADCSQLVERAGKKQKAAAYCERGWMHFQAEMYAEAIEDFSEAITLRPDLADAHCGRGVARATRGEFQQALLDLSRALRLDPKDDTALVSRAHLHRERGHDAKALRDLNKAIRLCPHCPDNFRERGQIYLDGRDADRALADFNAAILLDPDDAENYELRADAFAFQGKPSESARDRAWAEHLRKQANAKPSHQTSPYRDGILPANAANLTEPPRSPRTT